MFSKKMSAIMLLMIIGVLIGVCSQMVLKSGLKQTGELKLDKISAIPVIILKLLTNRLVVFGLLLSGFAAFFWLVVLSRKDLSFGYPLAGAIFYIFLFIASWLILKENITLTKILGTVIISMGIIILIKGG